jgi:hypothetical protein
MTDTKVRKKVREQKVNKLLGPWKVEDERSDLKLSLRVVIDPDKLFCGEPTPRLFLVLGSWGKAWGMPMAMGIPQCKADQELILLTVPLILIPCINYEYEPRIRGGVELPA